MLVWDYSCKSAYAAYNGNLVNVSGTNKCHSNFKSQLHFIIMGCAKRCRRGNLQFIGKYTEVINENRI